MRRFVCVEGFLFLGKFSLAIVYMHMLPAANRFLSRRIRERATSAYRWRKGCAMNLWKNLHETFRNREMMGTIFHLAWPTVVEQALQTVVSYADTAQVGVIGANASASVGLTTSMMWLVNAPMFAVGMGFLSVISRSLGADDRQTARRAAMQAVWVTLILGIIEGIIAVSISPFLPVWLAHRKRFAAMRPFILELYRCRCCSGAVPSC